MPPIAMRTFQSLTPAGLRRDHVAWRLWEKAKRLGTWNPAEIDLTRDAADWAALADDERDVLLHLAAYFAGGEEAVTLDLLPLLKAVADDGFVEDEVYLTSFLWEEAKHMDLFTRFFAEVAGGPSDLAAYEGAHYRQLFHEALPQAMHRLYTDASPEAQAAASVTYHMIVEGVLAETGYHVWYTVLDDHGILPGMVGGIQLVQRDESRHIRYGLYLLSRLVAAHGDALWMHIEATLMRLLPTALGLIDEVFERAERLHGRMPFGLERDTFADFAMGQFQKRVARLQKARGQTLEAICYGDPAPAPAVQPAAS